MCMNRCKIHQEVNNTPTERYDRLRVCGGGGRAFRVLVQEAEQGGVPQQVVHQIGLDVARTFAAIPEPRETWGWPDSMPTREREASLAKVLLAFESRALDSLGPRPRPLPMLLKIRRSWCGTQQGGVDAPLMRHSVGAETAEQAAGPVPTYVQGCSMMAAMCMGFTHGMEEEGFWLFAYLMEEPLGIPFPHTSLYRYTYSDPSWL